MQVIKRNGEHVNVRFDEITDRISSMCNGLNKIIDPVSISQEVGSRVRDGITTSELDQLTAKLCSNKITIHVDYGKLASRLVIDDHQKNCDTSFSDVCRSLYYNKDQLGEHCPLISEELYSISKDYNKEISEMIDHGRDYHFDYFGYKTLEHGYLIKIKGKCIETPQHMWMRVSLGIHGYNLKKAKETYDYMSKKYFTHATPTLFNSGTQIQQNSSCFLLGTEDSVEGIFKTISDCALISKWSGGIGVHISNIRGKGSYIRKTAGYSDGIVPMLRTYNSVARFINQGGGRRNGSIAIYLEPWNCDILDFLECKKNHGAEEQRARDLFYALWVPDLFMKRVKEGGTWALMCPSECPGLTDVYGDEFEELYTKYEKEEKYKRVVDAQLVWEHIINSQIETGTPYMCYKDSVNRKSNQKNIGVIKSSNLCVAPETMILTKDGYFEIKQLENKSVQVWNGEEWSNTTIRKTGENQELIKIKMSNGSIIECTKYHNFYVETGSRPSEKPKVLKVEAQNLKIGMKLIKHDLPITYDNNNEFKYAYTHGFFCADGTYHHNKYGKIKKLGKITLYGEKKELIKYLDVRTSSYVETSNYTLNVMVPLDINEKFTVPINYSIKSKLSWLAGYMDGDDSVSLNKDNQSLQACSIHKKFLLDIMLMLQTMGINSKVTTSKEKLPDGKGGLKEYNCKKLYRIIITSIGTQKLLSLGFSPKRIKLVKHSPNRDARQFVKIVKISYNGRMSDTYCFKEEKRGMGIFNGVLTGNCAEITEYSDTKEIAVCNLSSICLPKFVNIIDDKPVFNFEELIKITKVVTANLNRIIDVNYYPTPETKLSNLRHRPIGIGVQGLADAYNKMRYPFDSPEAYLLNKQIFETIYFAALTESCELAKTEGHYETFKGSPFSQGLFQFDLWEDKESCLDPILNYDWESLRSEVIKHGTRNSLLTALMPTASTSQILGANECFEPRTSNLYARRTFAGEFQVVNEYLIEDLTKLGIWNNETRHKLIENEGSVQNIEGVPQDIKDLYKTVWEIKQKVLIEQSAERGRFVDQSQSLNLFFDNPDYQRLTKSHYFGWSSGLKTGSYYIRSKPATNAKSTLKKLKVVEQEECISCSG